MKDIGAKVYWGSYVSIDPPKVKHDAWLRRKMAHGHMGHIFALPKLPSLPW
jgi:hypothetical protein